MVRRVSGGLVFVLFAALAVGLTVFGAISAVGVDVAPSWDGDSGGGGVDASGTGPATATQDDSTEFDRTVFRIEIFENGDARWTTQQSQPLNSETEEEQFRAFLDQFETEEMETFENFQIRAERLTESGTEATGREMVATAFDRSGEIDPLGQTRGIIEMSFVWTNFTEIDGDQLIVADIFSGGWAINDNQRLEIVADDNLTMVSVLPAPDSGSAEEGSVTWFGTQEFADQRPRIEVVPETETDGTQEENQDSDASDTADDETDTEGDNDTGIGFMAVALVLAIVFGLGGSLAWYSGVIRRSSSDETATGEIATGQQSASENTGPQATGTAETPPIEEPLSDDDRVVELLEQNGGRMKQVNIVERTEWSKSKVSMLLSDMEEEGQISKLRVGRENIISLAGQEPEAAGSPFDDE